MHRMTRALAGVATIAGLPCTARMTCWPARKKTPAMTGVDEAIVGDLVGKSKQQKFVPAFYAFFRPRSKACSRIAPNVAVPMPSSFKSPSASEKLPAPRISATAATIRLRLSLKST